MSNRSTCSAIVATAGILSLLSVSPAWSQSDAYYVIFDGLADGRSSAYTLETTGRIEMAHPGPEARPVSRSRRTARATPRASEGR